MRTRSLLPVLLLSLAPLAGCAGDTSASPAPDATDATVTSSTATDGVEPAYDCREVDGTEVCDTFDEADEGPGTDRAPAGSGATTAPRDTTRSPSAGTAPGATDRTAPVPTAPSTSVPAEVGHPEGPGTGSVPGTRRDCRELGGRQVCDTFGEGDEGPGTYDDRDEGPGTTG